MTTSQIIKQVQARMSDIMPGNQIEVSSHPFVDALLDSSVESFYMLMPTTVLPATDFSSATTTLIPSPEVKVYRIELPTEFIRLISFRCTEWRRSATKPLTEGTPQHNAQYGKHTFGGNARPQVTLVSNSTSGRSLEYYLFNKTTTVTTIQEATCATKGTIETIPDILIDPFAWYVASLALDAMQEYDAAKACMSHVQLFIESHK